MLLNHFIESAGEPISCERATTRDCGRFTLKIKSSRLCANSLHRFDPHSDSHAWRFVDK